jgi:hypothetical protein
LEAPRRLFLVVSATQCVGIRRLKKRLVRQEHTDRRRGEHILLLAAPQEHYFFLELFFFPPAFLAAFFLATVTSSLKQSLAADCLAATHSPRPPLLKSRLVARRGTSASRECQSIATIIIASTWHIPTHDSNSLNSRANQSLARRVGVIF